MNAAALNVSLRKEARALLPMWAGCMLGIAAAAALSTPLMMPFALLTYVLGSVALGAHAMGHEYGHRTVGLLLSQPVNRRTLLLVKLSVLTPLLAALGALAVYTVLADLSADERSAFSPAGAAFLILLSALCVAPTLTMLCRSGIAGLVFTVGIAGNVSLASQLIGYGRGAQIWFWYTMLMVCALGALVGWRHFSRLEAIDGRGRDFHLPGLASSSAGAGVLPAPARNAIRRLIAKELRLQQMTFVMAGVCLLTVAVMLLRRSLDPGFGLGTLMGITILCAGLLPLLIGCLASAEERQMGTLEWQQLMPMPAVAQFAVKAAVVIVLSLVLALGLPLLTMWLIAADIHYREWPLMAVAVVLGASVSLYVSSLCSSGVRAVLIVMPSILAAMVMLGLVRQWMFRLIVSLPGLRPLMPGGTRSGLADVLILASAGIALSALFLYFAHKNHRSSERPFTLVKRQAGWISGAVVLEQLVLILLNLR